MNFPELLYLLIALQALDLLTTVIALRNPRLGEGNGILKPLFDRFGALPVLLVVKVAFIAWLMYFRAELMAEVIAVLCAGYVYVVFNNIRLIRNS